MDFFIRLLNVSQVLYNNSLEKETRREIFDLVWSAYSIRAVLWQHYNLYFSRIEYVQGSR